MTLGFIFCWVLSLNAQNSQGRRGPTGTNNTPLESQILKEFFEPVRFSPKGLPFEWEAMRLPFSNGGSSILEKLQDTQMRGQWITIFKKRCL